MTGTLRCRCGKPSDGWPDGHGIDRLCQECWEADCAESFWEFVALIGKLEEAGLA